MSGYYHIHNTCPALYDKTISRVVKQLKKDKTAYSLLEVNQDGKHLQNCNEINYKGPRCGGTRKIKACLICAYKKDGRNTSTKTTIIVIKEDKI